MAMEQLHRVERYLKRIRDIYSGTAHKFPSSDYYEDDVISFFIHCYHLSDWIIQLNRAGSTKKEVNNFINSHNELIICADLANGLKHCKLERVRGNSQPHVAGRDWFITTYTKSSGLSSKFQARYKVLASDSVYDCLELAERCYILWKKHIKKLVLKGI